MEPVTAYLGLGSNLGQREENLVAAIELLRNETSQPGAGQADPKADGLAIGVSRVSSLYETAPWGYANQPSFLNCAVEVRTALSPVQLLSRVKELEQEMGRQPGIRFGPRLIDVDILLYSNMAVSLPDLQIPHPRLHQRAFALIPLSELAADVVPPGLQATIAQLADQADERDGVKKWGPPPILS